MENVGDHVAIIRQCRLFPLRLLYDSRSARDVLPGLAHNSTTSSETGRKTVSNCIVSSQSSWLLIYFYALVSSRSFQSLIMCLQAFATPEDMKTIDDKVKGIGEDPDVERVRR